MLHIIRFQGKLNKPLNSEPYMHWLWASQGGKVKDRDYARTECMQSYCQELLQPSRPGELVWPAWELIIAHLGTAVRSLTHTKPNKGRIGHFHQDVVHAVDVDVADSPSLHVLHDLIHSQRSVKSSVSIWINKKKNYDSQHTHQIVDLIYKHK